MPDLADQWFNISPSPTDESPDLASQWMSRPGTGTVRNDANDMLARRARGLVDSGEGLPPHPGFAPWGRQILGVSGPPGWALLGLEATGNLNRLDPIGETLMRLPEYTPYGSATWGVPMGAITNRAEEINRGGGGTLQTQLIEQRRNARQQEEHDRSLAAGIVDDLLHIPAMLGEFYAGGQILRGMGIGASAATSTAGRIGGTVARGAAVTPFVPSSYVDSWTQSNREHGRSMLDLQGLPMSFLGGVIQNTLLGSFGGHGEKITGDTFKAALGRVGAKAGIGLAEQAGADVLFGAINRVVPEAYRTHTDFGLVGDLVRISQGDPDAPDQALRRATRQAVIFAIFAGMHEVGRPPTPPAPQQAQIAGLLGPPGAPAPAVAGPGPRPGPSGGPQAAPGPQPTPSAAPGASQTPQTPSQAYPAAAARVMGALKLVTSALYRLPKKVVAEQLQKVQTLVAWALDQGMQREHIHNLIERDPSLETATKEYGKTLTDIFHELREQKRQTPAQPGERTQEARAQEPFTEAEVVPQGRLAGQQAERLVGPAREAEPFPDFLQGQGDRLDRAATGPSILDAERESDWTHHQGYVPPPEPQTGLPALAPPEPNLNLRLRKSPLISLKEFLAGNEGRTPANKEAWDYLHTALQKANPEAKAAFGDALENLNLIGRAPNLATLAALLKTMDMMSKGNGEGFIRVYNRIADRSGKTQADAFVREVFRYAGKHMDVKGFRMAMDKHINRGQIDFPTGQGQLESKPTPKATVATQYPVTPPKAETKPIAPMDIEAAMTLKKLTGPEKQVVRRRVEGETLEAIGKSLGVTREAIRQREAKIVKKLGIEWQSLDAFVESAKKGLQERLESPAVIRKGGRYVQVRNLETMMAGEATEGGMSAAARASREKAEIEAEKRNLGKEGRDWLKQQKGWDENLVGNPATVEVYLGDMIQEAVTGGQDPVQALANRLPPGTPLGRIAEIVELHKGANNDIAALAEKYGTTVDEVRSALSLSVTEAQARAAGFTGPPGTTPGDALPTPGGRTGPAEPTQTEPGGAASGGGIKSPQNAPRWAKKGREGFIDLDAFFGKGAADSIRNAIKNLTNFIQEWSSKMFPDVKRLSHDVNAAMGEFVNAFNYAKKASGRWMEKIFTFDPKANRFYMAVLQEMRLRWAENAYRQEKARTYAEHQTLNAQAAAERAAGNTAKADSLEAQAKKKLDLSYYYSNRMNDIAGRTFVGVVNGHGETPIASRQAFDALFGGMSVSQFVQLWHAGTLPQGLKADPNLIKVMDGWRKFGDNMDAKYKQTKYMAPTDPINAISQMPGLPINFIALEAGQTSTNAAMFFESQKGNLRNPKSKRHPFDETFTGTAAGYEMDPQKIIEQIMMKTEKGAALARMYKEAVDKGVAKPGKPGRAPDAEFKYEHQSALPPKGTPFSASGETSLWFKSEGAAAEFRKAVQVDKPYSKFLGWFGDIANFLTLASWQEASYHAANLFLAEFSGGRTPFVDSYRNIKHYWANDPAFRDQVAELARIGVHMRESHGGMFPILERVGLGKLDLTRYVSNFIALMDNIQRVGLDQAFDTLVKRGVYENTQANRRDFINTQLGNYNANSTNRWIQFLRDTGFQPFAVAASTFYMHGLRSVLGFQTPITPKDAAGRIKGRGELILRFAGMAALVAAANTIMHGRPDGDEDTPMGAILLWHQNGKPVYLDVLRFTMPFARGARATGLRAAAEGVRSGRSAEGIADQAISDVLHSALHQGIGPPGQFLAIAATGRDATGHQVAQQRGGMGNVGAAIGHTSPVVARFGSFLPEGSATDFLGLTSRHPQTTGEAIIDSARPWVGIRNQPVAVSTYNERLRSLTEARQTANRRGQPFANEREYQILNAFHGPMGELDRAIRGVVQTRQGIRQGGHPDSARLEELRRNQADLARRALEALR